MTSLAIRPPSTLTDPDEIARWFAEQIPIVVEMAVHRLLLGALEARVIGYHVPVDDGRRTEPLHALFAPYRRRDGGEAKKTEDWLDGLAVMPRRRSLDRRYIP